MEEERVLADVLASGGRLAVPIALHDFPGTGRGVQVLADVAAGQELVRVPLSICFTAERARRQLPRSLLRHTCHASPSSSSSSESALFDSTELLILLLLHERSKGKRSRQWSYFASLPESYPTHLMYWTDEDLAHLQRSPLVFKAQALRQQVRADYEQLKRKVEAALLASSCSVQAEGGASNSGSDNRIDKGDTEMADFHLLPDSDSDPFDVEYLSLENYMWALATVWSRSMDFGQVDEQCRWIGDSNKRSSSSSSSSISTPSFLRVLVPLADMFNHSPHVPCSHALDLSRMSTPQGAGGNSGDTRVDQAMTDVEARQASIDCWELAIASTANQSRSQSQSESNGAGCGAYVVVTSQVSLAAGEQAFINYGNPDNAKAVLSYGFAMRENPSDKLDFYGPSLPSEETVENHYQQQQMPQQQAPLDPHLKLKRKWLSRFGLHSPQGPYSLDRNNPLPAELVTVIKILLHDPNDDGDADGDVDGDDGARRSAFQAALSGAVTGDQSAGDEKAPLPPLDLFASEGHREFVRGYLWSAFQESLEAYATRLEEDGVWMLMCERQSSSSMSSNGNNLDDGIRDARRRFAAMVRMGEKQILRLAQEQVELL